MALDPDQSLQPTEIARREFSLSFRGYDQEEVRQYLTALSQQISADLASQGLSGPDAVKVAELLRERQELNDRINELNRAVDDANAALEEAVARAEKAEAEGDPRNWDEARIDALVGEETALVLEAARTAATSIRKRAEADADARLKVAEERQRTVEAEIAAQRETWAAELAALRSETEEWVETLKSESEAKAKALIDEAEAEATEERDAAESEAKLVRTAAREEADRLREESEAAAAALRAQVEAEAEAVREEAEEDAHVARDRVKEETRLMLSEAQAVRERMLTDLVKRRRNGRTQLDQIKAARDRMARSLAIVRRELDEAIEELEISVPEAKAAMEDVARAARSTPDPKAVLELASELDRKRASAAAAGSDVARTEGSEPASSTGDSSQAPTPSESKDGPESDEGLGEDVTPDAADGSDSGAAERAQVPEAGEDDPRSEADNAEGEIARNAETDDPADNDAADVDTSAEVGRDAHRDTDEIDIAEGDAVAADADDDAANADVEDGVDDDLRAEADPADTDGADGDEAESTAHGAESDFGEDLDQRAGASSTRTEARPAGSRSASTTAPTKVESLFDQIRSSVGNEAAANPSPQIDPDLDSGVELAEDDDIDLLGVFIDRDMAVTRYGPALRRQLKRALADDQSDVLDRVRRAKQPVDVDDLPPVERQVLMYLDAVADSLHSIARAGAESAGGTVSENALTDLVDRLARSIADPLRSRVERSIDSTGGDTEELLEPIRAHYRDIRANELPALAEDAMAEAFAIGVYEAIDKGTSVLWVADPRHEPGADCYDNTLAGPVTKPSPFPTGRSLPLGGPGCRCVVITEAMAAE